MSPITSEQLRAARGLLKWSVATLADKSGFAVNTIKRWESGSGLLNTTAENNLKIKSVLEATGLIVFPDSQTIKITTRT